MVDGDAVLVGMGHVIRFENASTHVGKASEGVDRTSAGH
jgi:hypothetical protein